MKNLSKRILATALAVTMAVGLTVSASAANPMSWDVDIQGEAVAVNISDVTKVEQVLLPCKTLGALVSYEEVTMIYVPEYTNIMIDTTPEAAPYEGGLIYYAVGYGGDDAIGEDADVSYRYESMDMWFDGYYGHIMYLAELTESGYPHAIYMLKDGVFICSDNVDVFTVVGEEAVAEEVIEEVVVPTAAPTASTVLVDGEEVAFDAYNIDYNNYFKLRDIAMILSGSVAQFEVTWNQEAGAIEMTSGEAYTEVGGELAIGDGAASEYAESTAVIYLDGEMVELTAYTINDNNFFKLRDLGEALGFNVSWDGDAQTIVIASDEAYTAD